MPSTTPYNLLNVPFLDQKTGLVSWVWMQTLILWQKQISGGFDQNGNLIGSVSPTAEITGRTSIGTILQNVDNAGNIKAAGLPQASPTQQGAVLLPAGATGHTLGSAAMKDVSAFDAAGSASAAQSNAETFATSAANTAKTDAESYTDNAISAAFSEVTSGTVTLAKLTTGGANGSLTFTKGLITAYNPPS